MQSIHDIKAKAKAHKITMAAVCNEAGIQQSQVSRWLSGTVEPLWTSVNQLHLALEKLIEQSPVHCD
jgi:predicted transcriptional regulator